MKELILLLVMAVIVSMLFFGIDKYFQPPSDPQMTEEIEEEFCFDNETITITHPQDLVVDWSEKVNVRKGACK